MTGNELRQRRIALNLRQEDLARELKVVVSSVARWEQLKEQKIANSRMLDLALRTIEGDFLIYNINLENENAIFSRENQLLLHLLPQLNEAMDTTVKQIKPFGRVELIVYMLSRLCFRHYHAILLLCSNGQGFSAMRVLRSMFEKAVDAAYLNNYPDEIDDFINYHLVQLKKTGFIELAKQIDPNFENVVKSFQIPSSTRLRISWSKNDLVTRAQKVKSDPFIVRYAYRLPNEFVHSSLSEIMFSLIEENDGSLSPVETENEVERAIANTCFSLASFILKDVLRMLVVAFDLPNQPLLDEYENAYDEVFSWRQGIQKY